MTSLNSATSFYDRLSSGHKANQGTLQPRDDPDMLNTTPNVPSEEPQHQSPNSSQRPNITSHPNASGPSNIPSTS